MTMIMCFILLTSVNVDPVLHDSYIEVSKVVSIDATVTGSELMIIGGKNPIYINVTETPKQVTDKIRACGEPSNLGIVR